MIDCLLNRGSNEKLTIKNEMNYMLLNTFSLTLHAVTDTFEFTPNDQTECCTHFVFAFK